jgi:hypothetical protein
LAGWEFGGNGNNVILKRNKMVKEDNRKFNYWLTPNRFHLYGVMCLNTIDLFETFCVLAVSLIIQVSITFGYLQPLM